MNSPRLEIDFSRPACSGIYAVDDDDLRLLATQAEREELQVCRIPLQGCRDKTELLRRMAASLQFPSSFGFNWDALADCLRDLRWLPGWGHALLLEHAEDLRSAAAADFDVLLGILDDAASFAVDEDRPFFALLNLPPDAPLRRRG